MSKKTRGRLFYLLLLLFAVLGTAIVFYAQGWRLDPATLRASKIGALYVATRPEGASVALNGQPVTRPFRLFDSGTLVNDLFPKRYELTLSHDGYRPWRMHVDVKPSLVTEVKHAVLIPDSGHIVRAGRFEEFWVLPGGMVVRDVQGSLWGNASASLPGDVLAGWSDNGPHALLWDESSRNYAVVDIRTALSRWNAEQFSEILRERYSRRPYELTAVSDASAQFLAASHGELALFLPELGDVSVLATSSASTGFGKAASRSGRVLWSVPESSGTSTVFAGTLQRGAEILAVIPGTTVDLQWGHGGRAGILQDGGDLYLYTPRSGSPAVRANDVKTFAFSPSGAYLAALENHSLEVFGLEREEYWRFNIPRIAEATSLSWYRDERHLVIHFADQIQFLDLGDRALENLSTAARTDRGIYVADENALYVSSADGIARLQFP